MLIRHNEDDLDKVFRQKLYNAEEEFPAHLWDGIRQNKPKRKAFLFWWMLPIALLIGGAFVYALNGRGLNSPAIAQSIQDKNTQSAQIKPSIENTNSEEKTQNTISDNERLKIEQPTATPDKSNYAAAQSKPQVSDDAKSVQVLDDDHLSIEGTHQANKTESQSLFKIDNTIQQTKNSADLNLPVAISTNASTKADDKTITPTALALTESQNEKVIYKVDTSSFSDKTVSAKLKQEIEKDVFSGEMPYIEPLVVTTPSRWSIGAYYLLSQPIRTARPATNDAAFNAFISRTKPGLSHGFGLMASYVLSQNVNLSVGLEYQQFKEKHRWIDSTITQHKTYIFDYDTLQSMDVTTVTQTIIDSIVTEELSVQSRERINRYSSVNVPVLLSWNYPVGKYSIGLEIGPVFKISTTYTGHYVFGNWVNSPVESGIWNQLSNVTTTTQKQQFEIATARVYRNWRTDLHIGIQQTYLITPKMTASLSLQTRMMMSDSNTSFEVVHRIIQPGVRIGFNYFIR